MRFRAELGPVAVGPDRWEVRLWAPRAERVSLRLVEPDDRVLPMERERRGYWSTILEGVPAGALYRFQLDGERERADPASRHQPRGVHGPSRLVDPAFAWTDDDWGGLPFHELILYELHVGTFSPEGTFDGVLDRLGDLERLGITALELMPVAQFPGDRNWGYDGVLPFAVQDSYGGPEGLKRLVDACHARGIAVFLDVVYNHLGPEGCYLDDFGPYFTDHYRTPWGRALNFDGAGSDEVRRYFVENALYWVSEFHIDGLRLDAVHGIIDPSAIPFLEELVSAVHAEAARQERHVHVVAENDRNDPRILSPPELGGHGFDGVWNDDFHHALHGLLTGEHDGYYRDYGSLQHLETALRDGFVLAGEYSIHRDRRHGRSSRDVEPHRLVVFLQNHDQVGNRAQGERLSDLVGLEKLKLGAACTLLSPYVPLLFMGEEYGDLSPFLYFVDHADPALADAVREGRRREFAEFGWPENVPDPLAEDTFAEAKLEHGRREVGWHRALFAYYRELVGLRRGLPALTRARRGTFEVRAAPAQRLLALEARHDEGDIFLYLHFGEERRPPTLVPPQGVWMTLLDSAAGRWGGPGDSFPAAVESDGSAALRALQPWSAVLLRRSGPVPGTEHVRA